LHLLLFFFCCTLCPLRNSSQQYMCVVSFAFVVYFCSTLFLFLSLFLSLLLLDDDDNNDDSLMINNSSSLTLPLCLSLSFLPFRHSNFTEPRRLSSTDRRAIDGHRRLNLQFSQSSCDLWRTRSRSPTPLAVTPSRLSIPSFP